MTTSTVNAEQVLVLPEAIAQLLLTAARGGAVWPKKAIQTCDTFRFMDRAAAEQDPTFKQVIPYGIIMSSDMRGCQVFAYQRTKAVGESRLADFHSIGFGGHINPEDVEDAMSPDNGVGLHHLIISGLRRELREELKIPPVTFLEPVGLLYDDSNAVGQVHLGFVYFVWIKDADASIRDEALKPLGWRTPNAIKKLAASLEPWSKKCLPWLATVGDRSIE